jgi:hypothetical protein
MLIKEYRIPLPLTVEEYKIAQLYMIAKKSREETKVRGRSRSVTKTMTGIMNEHNNNTNNNITKVSYRLVIIVPSVQQAVHNLNNISCIHLKTVDGKTRK